MEESVKYLAVEPLEPKLMVVLVLLLPRANQDIAHPQMCVLLPVLCLSPLAHIQMAVGAMQELIARQGSVQLTSALPVAQI